MSERPKVSIIIATQNNEPVIGNCLESIWSREFSGVEVIAVDLNSTDGTKELLAEIASEDEQVTFLADSMESFGHAKNMGMNRARGEYILFMDPGDEFYKDALEYMCHKLDEEPWADMFTAETDSFGDDAYGRTVEDRRRVMGAANSRDNRKQEMDSRLFRSWIFDNITIYRASFLQDKGIRFFEEPGYGRQDNAFRFLAMVSGVPSISVDPLYERRMDDEERKITDARSVTDICDEFRFLEKRLKEDQSLWWKYRLVFWQAYYDRNMLLYERLSDDLKPKLSRRMQADINSAIYRKEYSREHFDITVREEMELLIKSPDEFDRCQAGKIRKRERARVQALNKGNRFSELIHGITTFHQAAEDWINERRGNISDASVDRYEYLMDKYILPEFGDWDVSKVNMTRINTYLADLADREKHGEAAIGGTTIESLQSLAGSVLSFVAKRGSNVPALDELVKIEKNSYKPLSSDEIRRLIGCARYNKSPELLGVLLSLYAGLGTGEICALSWDDFDLGRREIHVRHMLYRLKNKDGGEKRTRLAVMDVRKANMRTVQYPGELDGYVKELYQAGCVMLTGEKERYMEQRTLCNRLDSVFKLYHLGGLTLQRVKKTYEAGLSDIRYLTDPFYEKTEGSSGQIQTKVDERWLIKEMENDLKSLRWLIGLSSRELGSMMGLSERDYEAIEAGEAAMDWDMFLAFLFLFKYNSKTEPIVEALGLYPNALKERMEIG